MEIIDLVGYIKEGTFLHEDDFHYDAVVWENLPADLPKGKTQHITMSDLSYDFGVTGQLSTLSAKHTHILLIIETFNSSYLIPWLSSFSDKKNHVTILSLSA